MPPRPDPSSGMPSLKVANRPNTARLGALAAQSIRGAFRLLGNVMTDFDLSIQTKLITAFALVTSFTVLASAAAFMSLQSMSAKLFQIEMQSLPHRTHLLSL